MYVAVMLAIWEDFTGNILVILFEYKTDRRLNNNYSYSNCSEMIALDLECKR